MCGTGRLGAGRLAPAPAGYVEAGTPAFTVLGPESLGLTNAPIDFHVLPDGRLLAMGQTELALGDGARWHRFAQAAGQPHVNLQSVAVDADGRIYAGFPHAFAEVVLNPDSTWSLAPVQEIPTDSQFGDPQPTSVQQLGQEWYWWWGAGPIFAWSPGQPVRVLGIGNEPRAFFHIGPDTFYSDGATGRLHQLRPDRFEPLPAPQDLYAESAINATVGLPDGRTLLGTAGRGLMVRENGQFVPFMRTGLLSQPIRINALCTLGNGTLAAASDNIGIILFRPDGRIVQVLDRANDHRLARVRKLVPAPDGTLWALLNNGVARIEAATRVSYYESLVSTGLSFAEPFRFQDRLWLLSDGRIQRAIYDADQRVIGFAIDSPPGFANTLFAADDTLFAGSRSGLFRRDASGTWTRIGTVNSPLFRDEPVAPGRWLFVAENQVGWLRHEADAFTLETFTEAGLGHPYGVVTDGAGDLWTELGTGRIARIKPTLPRPLVTTYGPDHAFGMRWPNLFVLAGEARINVPWQIFHLNPSTAQIEPDTAVFDRFPLLRSAIGRPVEDARGRVWISREDGIRILDGNAAGAAPVEEVFPADLAPLHFYPEAGGVMWMHQPQHLVRFDPSVPLGTVSRPVASILRVQPSVSKRAVFPSAPGATLGEFTVADTLLINAVALHSPPRRTVTFQHRLEGRDPHWIDSDSSGTFTVGPLEPGDYRLGVQPVVDGQIGKATTVRFNVAVPWYRTVWAYLGFFLAGAALLAGVAWLSSFIVRQKNAFLDRLVRQRTGELSAANVRLAAQVRETERKAADLVRSQARIAQLNEELEHRVQQRTAELDAANRELEAFSYSVAHDLRTPIGNLGSLAKLLRAVLAPAPGTEPDRMSRLMVSESARLVGLVDRFLNFARRPQAELNWQPVPLGPLLDSVRAELEHQLAPSRVVDWQIASELPTLGGDPTLLRQVFVNLLSNALKFTSERPIATIRIETRPAGPEQVEIRVRDNGAGFAADAAESLFEPFRRLHPAERFPGTGVGLANVQRIVARHGGSIRAEAAPEAGATFFITLPTRPPAVAGNAAPAP